MKITLEAQKKIIYHLNKRTHGNREKTNYLIVFVVRKLRYATKSEYLPAM